MINHGPWIIHWNYWPILQNMGWLMDLHFYDFESSHAKRQGKNRQTLPFETHQNVLGYCSYWWLNSNLGENLKKQQHIRCIRFKGIGRTHKNHRSHSSIHTVDGQNPKQPPGMLKKTLFINGDNHHPWWCRIKVMLWSCHTIFFHLSTCHLLGSIKVHHWQQAHGAGPQGLDFFRLRLTP